MIVASEKKRELCEVVAERIFRISKQIPRSKIKDLDLNITTISNSKILSKEHWTWMIVKCIV
jgi:hypothetical protein